MMNKQSADVMMTAGTSETEFITLRIGYIGFEYHGFQIQPDVPTVQGELLKTFALLDKKIKLRYASRTDARVSAIDQIIVIKDSERALNLDIIFKAARRLSQRSIFFYAYTLIPFRFSQIISKTYAYFLKLEKPNLEAKLRQLLSYLNNRKLNYYYLIKRPSITAQEPYMTIRTSMRRIQNGVIVLFFTAKRFYWQQVRKIVSLIVSTTLGYITPKKFRSILNGEKPKSGIPPAPPEGLVLWKIKTTSDKEFIEIINRKHLENIVVNAIRSKLNQLQWVYVTD